MNITQEQNPTNVADKTSKCILSGCSCLCHSMDSIRMEGRGPSLLSPRRLKSLKCVVVGVVVFNLLLFLTLTWETGSNAPNISTLQRGLLGRGDQEPVNQKGTGWHDIEMKKDIVGGASDNAEIDTGGMLRAHGGVKGTDSKLILTVNGAQKSACFYRTAAYVNNRHIKLTQPPFLEYVNGMTCLEDGNIAVFSSKFARFNNVIIDSSKTSNKMKGGENIEDVWNQKESDEYFTLLPGYFTVPCSVRPNIQFSGLDHLSSWSSALRCYTPNAVDIKSMPAVRSPTLAIQRYEYVNLYHTMTDFYNAFVLMLIFGIPPSKLNILFVDAHPVGKLDEVWGTLFGKYMRAGHLKRPTVFHNLAWGFLGYSSPLNHHERAKVPYLEEFREFFLTRHNVSDQHRLDCKKLNVI